MAGGCGFGVGSQPEGGVEPLPAGCGGLEGWGAEVERLAVVGLEREQAQGHRRDARIQQGTDGGEVAQGFGHLLAAHIDHAVVQPVASQLVAGGRLRLGNFVFVVGKDQVGATEVDVDRVAQLLAHHGGAFDVPAGPARAPGGFPAGLARFGALPEGKVEGVLLAGFLCSGHSTGCIVLLLS